MTPEDRLFSARYEAIRARDPRFDGQFFTAVRSTMVYCRPSCPARTPAAGNVRFFTTSAAAQAAGYRACKRCQPEATAGSPRWNWRDDIVGRAVRLIDDGVIDRGGVASLAAQLGYSPRQLNRILAGELGVGPLALARAHRVQAAASLLTQTRLPLPQVAKAAGFGSMRQFTQTISQTFNQTPTQLRQAASPGGATSTGPATDNSPRPVSLSLSLPVRRPFNVHRLFAFLLDRAIPGVEAGDAGGDRPWYARSLALPHGSAVFKATWDNGLKVDFELTAPQDVAVGVARVRRLFDLDADPQAVDTALARIPVFAGSVSADPGVRLPGSIDPHEMVIRAIVGQQISVAAARGHLGRLTAACGSPINSALGVSRLFPSPAQVAELLADQPNPDQPLPPDRPLRLPRRALRTLRDIALALADGSLAVDVGQSHRDLVAELTHRRGIGPWTAAYVALRALGQPDLWLPGDVGLLRGARAAGLIDPAASTARQHRQLESLSYDWSPWRSYAVIHLWQLASPTVRKVSS